MPDDVLTRLLQILPEHVRDALTLTLYFGFRRGEVFTLKAHQVDFETNGVRLFAENVKDNEDAFLPGAPEAMALLKRLVAQAKDRNVDHLIAWRRFHKSKEAQEKEPWRPINGPKRAWATAMTTIEREFGRRWRWHDLRAAFITHVAMTSGPVAAQLLARHSDYDTTGAYIEVADETRRLAADRAAQRPALMQLSGEKSQTEVTDGPEENYRKSG